MPVRVDVTPASDGDDAGLAVREARLGSMRRKLMSSCSYRLVVFAIALFAVGASTLSAAEQTATVSGVVSDQTGAAVAGAKVQFVHGLVVTRSVVTDREGRYRVESLQPGGYTVRVAAPGFQSTEQRVTAASGTATAAISGSPCSQWRRASW
jgi:hypothetical protein